MKLWFTVSYWLPFFFVITVFSLLIYLVAQQNFRTSANDPQIQMAEDTALALNEGQDISKIVSGQKIDIGKSLVPFLIVYDKTGKEIITSAMLEGQVPKIPVGVLFASTVIGENRLTWQPAVGVRIAAVVVPFSKGYVLAGRSLREVEKREEAVGIYVFAAWLINSIGSLVIIFLLSLFGMFIKKSSLHK